VHITANPEYKYLAQVEAEAEVVRNLCVKKATVIGLDSRETVTIKIDGITHHSVPVRIHTDIGARMAVIRETDEGVPANLFEDAALMFPLPGGSLLAYVDEEGNRLYSRAPEVLTVVEYSDSGSYIVRYVCGILDSGLSIYGPWPTYRPFLKVTLTVDYAGMVETVSVAMIVYDIIHNRIASMPTQTEIKSPPEYKNPFVDAAAYTSLYAQEIGIAAILNSVLAGGITVGQPTTFTFEEFGDKSYQLAAGSSLRCNIQGGGESLAWEVISIDNTYIPPTVTTVGRDIENKYYLAGCYGGTYRYKRDRYIYGSILSDGSVTDRSNEATTQDVPILAKGSGTVGRVIDMTASPEFGVFHTYFTSGPPTPAGLDPIQAFCYQSTNFLGSMMLSFNNGMTFRYICSGSYELGYLREVSDWTFFYTPFGFADKYDESLLETRKYTETGTLISPEFETEITRDCVFNAGLTRNRGREVWPPHGSVKQWYDTNETRYYIQKYILGCFEEQNFLSKIGMCAPVVLGWEWKDIEYTTEILALPYTKATQSEIRPIATGGCIALGGLFSISEDVAQVIADKMRDLVSIPSFVSSHAVCEFVLVPFNAKIESLRG